MRVRGTDLPVCTQIKNSMLVRVALAHILSLCVATIDARSDSNLKKTLLMRGLRSPCLGISRKQIVLWPEVFAYSLRRGLGLLEMAHSINSVADRPR